MEAMAVKARAALEDAMLMTAYFTMKQQNSAICFSMTKLKMATCFIKIKQKYPNDLL